MRLILTSTGFSSPAVAKRCAGWLGKPRAEIKVAVVSEAHIHIHGDHGWLLDDLKRVKDHFEYMELVNLQALDPGRVEERIRAADIVFVTGGDPDYLMSVFNRTGFGRSLPKLLETGIYVGSSAGAMVAGRRVTAEAYLRIYGETTEARYDVSEWLGLVDLAVHPHFEADLDANNRPDVLLDSLRGYEGAVYALRDDAALVVDGNKLDVIGSAPLVIKDGRLPERSRG